MSLSSAVTCARGPFASESVCPASAPLRRYYEASKLWPGVPVEAVVSVGSGTFFERDVDASAYGWGTIVQQLIDASTDTQRVHETLTTFLPDHK